MVLRRWRIVETLSFIHSFVSVAERYKISSIPFAFGHKKKDILLPKQKKLMESIHISAALWKLHHRIYHSFSQSINNVVGKKTRSPPKRCKGVVLTSNCAASTCSDIIYCNNFLSSGPTDRAQQILGDNALKWTRLVTTDATTRQPESFIFQ